ncbi:hypothetical protein NFI96_011311, partial [Prochilodus magdalenae]
AEDAGSFVWSASLSKPRGYEVSLNVPEVFWRGGNIYTLVIVWSACLHCLTMGRRTLLRLTDLWGDGHLTHHLEFAQIWKKQQRNYEKGAGSETEGLIPSSQSRPGLSLLHALGVTFRPSLLKAILLRLSSDLLSIFSLFALRWVVLFCEKQPVFDWAGYIYALVILGSVSCCAVSQHLLERLIRKTAASAHAALSGALYRQRSQVTIRAASESLIKEMLYKIKALKILAWEVFFRYRVAEAWERELETLQVLGYLASFSMLSRICIPYLVCLSSLGVFVLMDDGNVLTPSQVFMCLGLFRLLLPLFLKLYALSAMLKQLSDYSSQCNSCINVFPQGSGGALLRYLRAFGYHWVILTLLAQLGVCMACVAQDSLLFVWTAEAKEVQGLEEWKELRNSHLSFYTLLGLLQALLVCWAAYCLKCGSLKASQSLQCELLSSVLHLPLSVHQTTDPGHLLHTFTQDMYVVEELLPKQLHVWGSCLLHITATMLLVTFIIPVFSLALCPLTFLFLSVQSHFSSVQQHARYSSSSFSPVSVKQHSRHPFSPRMHEELCLNHSLQDISQNLELQHKSIVMERWALLKLDAVCAIGLFLITLALLDSADSLDSGIIALVLVYGFNAREAMHQFAAVSTETARSAVTVQSICVYTKMEKEVIPTEFDIGCAKLVMRTRSVKLWSSVDFMELINVIFCQAEWTRGCKAPPGWPQKGELEFIQYGTEAGAISPAFRGLSFSIYKGEKVGVLSREKAETDHLISCLFRAVEASCGAVLIDGVNIAFVGLHTLRSRLHLIPQVPVLFSGSLRANVDPLARCSDAQVWQVLELCQLKEKAQQLQGQLLHSTQPNSTAHSLLSCGQKRLLCLVRALLGKARVLLVEEALTLGDSESEHLLHQLVPTLLPECTVLWLCQNPNSVMHTDRVLVLDAGHAVEFDTPSILMQQGTLFRQLLQESERGHV